MDIWLWKQAPTEMFVWAEVPVLQLVPPEIKRILPASDFPSFGADFHTKIVLELEYQVVRYIIKLSLTIVRILCLQMEFDKRQNIKADHPLYKTLCLTAAQEYARSIRNL